MKKQPRKTYHVVDIRGQKVHTFSFCRDYANACSKAIAFGYLGDKYRVMSDQEYRDTESLLKECMTREPSVSRTYNPSPSQDLTWTVWWFETNKFNGEVTRVYRDFEDGDSASRYAMSRRGGAYYAQIKDTPWHHKHASIV